MGGGEDLLPRETAPQGHAQVQGRHPVETGDQGVLPAVRKIGGHAAAGRTGTPSGRNRVQRIGGDAVLQREQLGVHQGERGRFELRRFRFEPPRPEAGERRLFRRKLENFR